LNKKYQGTLTLRL